MSDCAAQDRAKAPASDDPLLSLQECADNLGVNIATFYRRVVPLLDIVVVSPRRRGVRQSVLEAYKRDRTRPALVR
jgi:hypothetical protein